MRSCPTCMGSYRPHLGVVCPRCGTNYSADTPDMVAHPPHYTSHPSQVEVIEYTRLLPFNAGNAVKYVMRREHKGQPREDLDKALWYLSDMIIHQMTYKIPPKLVSIVTPVISAEPDRTVRAFLREMCAQLGTGPDLIYARELVRDIKNWYPNE